MRGFVRVLSTQVVMFFVLVVSSSSSALAEESFCSPACALQKANENITLQMRYLMTKIETLKKDLADPEKDHQMVLDNLGAFCFKSESEEAQACFDRYQRFQVIALEKMKSAILQNENTMAGFNFKAESIEPGTKQIGTVPVVPTLVDLEADFQKNSKKQIQAEEFSKWAHETAREPSRDDFVQFQEIPRDPENPAAGTLSVIRTDAKGLADQEKAYLVAVENYKKTLGQKLKDDVADVDTKIGTGNMKKANLLTVTAPVEVKTMDSQKSYNHARNDIIKAFSVNPVKEVSVGAPVNREPTGKEQLDPGVLGDHQEHYIDYPAETMERDIKKAASSP